MVLQAAGLGAFAGDLGVIFAVDWLLDRVRAPRPRRRSAWRVGSG